VRRALVPHKAAVGASRAPQRRGRRKSCTPLERLWLADMSSVTLLPMAVPRTLTVSVELPLSADDGVPPDPTVVGDELRLLWIIEQVRLQRIGVGKGAELAGLPRAAFMQALGAHGVPVIDYAPSDLQRELDAQDAV
jgi:predicted HTH domain antitoxin